MTIAAVAENVSLSMCVPIHGILWYTFKFHQTAKVTTFTKHGDLFFSIKSDK